MADKFSHVQFSEFIAMSTNQNSVLSLKFTVASGVKVTNYSGKIFVTPHLIHHYSRI